MSGATGQDTYGNRGWGQAGGPWGQGNSGPWGQSNWTRPDWQGQGPTWGPPFWHPQGISRPWAIVFTVLGFMFWWPVGLAILLYLLGTGRMGCFAGSAWRAQKADWKAQKAAWRAWCRGEGPNPAAAAPSSGNRAFDEYRTETLRRLEEEQKEFSEFLERLRFAKDKAEFDQFMAERRSRPTPPPGAEPQPSA